MASNRSHDDAETRRRSPCGSSIVAFVEGYGQMQPPLRYRLTDLQVTIAQFLVDSPARKQEIDAHMGRKVGPSLNAMVTSGAAEATDGVYHLTDAGRAELAYSLSRSPRWTGPVM
jgi:hypothetical protein